MKRLLKIVLLYMITACLCFSSTLFGQSVQRSSGVVLRGTFWNVDSDYSSVSVSLTKEEVHVGPAGGWICFFSRMGDNSFLELSLGVAGKVGVNAFLFRKEEVEVSSMIPLLMGLRYNVLRLRNPSAIQPYVTFGGGPYWLFDISARDEWGLNEEVAIKSKTLAGVYGGGGMYFNIASWLAFNFDIKYHFINFDPNHDYSGFEFGMGFGILWGRYTPNG